MASIFQNKNIRVVFCGGVCICVLLFAPARVRAEEHGTLSVTPLFTDIALDASTPEQSFVLNVANETGNPVVLRISRVDFGSLNESGGIAFLGNQQSGNNRYALASWIIPEKDVVTLLPATHEGVKFTITNRDSLSPGGHYAAILFTIEQEGQDTAAATELSTISVSPAFSALVFVKKEGGVLREMSLSEQVVGEYSWFTGLPTKISVRFQNSGNVDLTPHGRFVLTDPFGAIVSKGILNEESGRILPESFRWYHTVLLPLKHILVPGFYALSSEYRSDGEETSHSLPVKRFFAWGIAGWFLVGGYVVVNIVLFLKKRMWKRRKTTAS